MLKHHSIQMELNFYGNKRNRFREHLDNGEFQILAEIPVPSSDAKLKDAVARFSDFHYLAESSVSPFASLAFVSPHADADSLDPVLFMSALCEHDPDRHLLYLGGRGRTEESVFEEAMHARSLGIRNFCAVSGNVPPHADPASLFRTFFCESVNMLHRLSGSEDRSLFLGATVNPFKYTPGDSSVQYCKAVRKIHNGASFLVTQYGWDMRKLQEFRWMLWRRNMNIPVLMRMLFLTPDRASDICAGKVPGIRISPDFENLLRREVQYSHAQFEAAQIRRIQIHAAGARLLGFSGIQLAGVDTPELFQSLLQRIGEAFREFDSFEEWKAAFQEYYARMDLAPYPYRFYLFENLFSQAQPPEEFILRSSPMPECSCSERFLFRLSGLLFSHASEVPARERRLSKKLIAGCRSCGLCRLPQTFYICPELCPKGMANGPCGCSCPDGSCEYTGRECLFIRMLRLSHATRDYGSMEQGCIPSPGRRPEKGVRSALHFRAKPD